MKPFLALLLSLLFLANVYTGFKPLIGKHHYDDAYITYRHALNLSEGRGMVFNAGEACNSASSFLYTVLLAACHRVGFTDLELDSSLIGLASALLLLGLTYGLALKLGAGQWLAFFSCLPLALCGSIAGWSVSGMETLFFSFCFMLFCCCYLAWPEKVVPAALSLALLLLCRLEAAAICLPLLALELKRGSRRRLLILGLAPLLLLIQLACFKLSYGEWLPHAVLAKSILRYYQDWERSKLWAFWLLSFPAYMACLPLALWQCRRPAAWAGPLGLLTAVFLLLAVLLTAGPYSDHMRYSVFIMPLAALIAALALEAWQIRFKALIGALLLLLALNGALSNRVFEREFWVQTFAGQRARSTLGRWVAANIPAGSLVASSDIGALAYAAPGLAFYDLSGLTSKSAADAARAGADALRQDFLARRPAYFIDTIPRGAKTSAEQMLHDTELYFVMHAQASAVDVDRYMSSQLIHSEAIPMCCAVGAFRIDWKEQR